MLEVPAYGGRSSTGRPESRLIGVTEECSSLNKEPEPRKEKVLKEPQHQQTSLAQKEPRHWSLAPRDSARAEKRHLVPWRRSGDGGHSPTPKSRPGEATKLPPVLGHLSLQPLTLVPLTPGQRRGERVEEEDVQLPSIQETLEAAGDLIEKMKKLKKWLCRLRLSALEIMIQY